MTRGKHLLQPLTCVVSVLLGMIITPVAVGEDDGWKPILNLKDHSGWKMLGKGRMEVEDGALVTHGTMGLFWYTKAKIGNAEIRVVFKTEKRTDNSGVFIRIDGEPKDPWFAVHNGYEVQIDNAADAWHETGTLYSLTKAKNKTDLKAGQWITMIIRLDGDRTAVTVNGTLVTDYKEGQPVPEKKRWYEPKRGPRPVSGYIGLQTHDGRSRVFFKEISVRPLKKD